MKNIRIWFKKDGACRYISHLDLNRVMLRALHKSKIPIWHTEGFNPHPFATFPLPLSLGFRGVNECMDVKLEDEEFSFKEIIDRLNDCLPPGIRIFDVTEAPTASVHASTVLKLKDGSVLAAWFGGTKEKDGDVRIWIARRNTEGWERPYQLESGIDKAHWNPVLFEKKSGEICLYYKVGDEIKDWKTYVASSFDGGKSFSSSRELVEGDVGGRGPVKNKPIYLSNGTLIAPASDESTPAWYAFMDLSEDDGQT